MTMSIFIDEKKRPDFAKSRRDSIKPVGQVMVDLFARLARPDPVSFRESFKETLLINPNNEIMIRLVLEKNEDIIGLMHLEKVKAELAKILPSCYA